MSRTHNLVRFGISIDPASADAQEGFIRARFADENGLDLITVMDHPYNARLFDSWTLLTALAMRTERVHLGGNVFNLPLRPPAMLAKMAATLDVLSGGRFEMGLGAGSYWDGIVAYGGQRRTPGEAYRAFKDALYIIKGMWEHAGRSFTYEGDIYQVQGARPGPAPAHPIPVWTGATGPKMLRLTGRMADGLLISHNYVPPVKLPWFNEQLDAGANEAGRAPIEIRRGYNLMGVLDLSGEDNQSSTLKPEYVGGDSGQWVEKILHWHHEYRQDTFIFWPIAGDKRAQIEVFAKEVVPAVKEALGQVHP